MAAGHLPVTMDYRVYRSTAELESTGYIELGPGRYTGKHWQRGFVFVWEDAFGMAEGILAKHFPAYDHFGMNDIPKEVALRIASEWREAAERLLGREADERPRLLKLHASFRVGLNEEVRAHPLEISGMLRDLAEAVEGFAGQAAWITVLGI